MKYVRFAADGTEFWGRLDGDRIRQVDGDISQISWISQIMPLEPGDVMLTGTPRGPSRLNIGDTVSVEIEGIGALTNSVVEGP